MKIALAIVACLGLASAASFHSTNEVKIADKGFLEKQKFLFEIVYRVEDPLMFDEYIKYGDKFIVDKSYYTHYDYYMEKFWESYKIGALLPKGEFFGALVKTHHKQVWGLFNFFYYAKDWDTFMHNVCWARMHVNEGMFVYALTMAVIHRDDFQGLILPTIYEILPQYFFHSKFIYEAEKFDFNVWNKLIMYEKELYDVYYRDNKYYHDDYVYIKDWKVWQWWKLMGLGEHWYKVDKFILRDNIYEYNQDSKWLAMMKDVNMWYMPVDYSRDIEIFNEHSKLAYFTEDVDYNAWWYYFNLDYSFFLDGDKFGLKKDRRGEYWIRTVQQVMARYYMERLSHGLGDIPEMSMYSTIEHGYDPELITYKGVGFSYRKNYWDIYSHGNFEMIHRITDALKRIDNIIDLGYYKTADGTTIDLHRPESVEFIGNMLQGNVDTYDRFFFHYWYLLAHMSFGEVDFDDMHVYPNVMLNFETMMRDPMYYMFYKRITDRFYHFMYNLKPYTHEELMYTGVEINDVEISELVTYFDFVDHDVTNLLNDKMVFDDGKFFWDKSLFARQMRLNHKPFTFDYTITADKPQKVVIRSFFGPKYDEFGRLIPLLENYKNFVQYDEFYYDMTAGKNVIKRSSDEFYWTIKDRTTYTELYKYLMMAYDGKFDFPLDISEPHCGYPDRMLLPKGWGKGMPMQFFFMVAPYHGDHEQFESYDYTYYCGIGSGVRFVDNRPFGYPFDRYIDETEFFVPNMYFKDVKVYHHDTMEAYYKNYSNYGKFDYTFFKDYYTKFFKN